MPEAREVVLPLSVEVLKETLVVNKRQDKQADPLLPPPSDRIGKYLPASSGREPGHRQPAKNYRQ